MNAQDIKRLAYECGADLCGITTLDRFEGCPPQMDPRFIMPEAKSMIVMAFRVMRGSLRGIEEGTFFSNYSAMGYGGLTYNYIPMTVINMCRVIEDEGYEAIPIGHQSDWRAIDNNGNLRARYSKPVEEGKPADGHTGAARQGQDRDRHQDQGEHTNVLCFHWYRSFLCFYEDIIPSR